MSVNQSRAIREAVTELLVGTIGTTRVVPKLLFEPGTFTGQPTAAQQVKSKDLRFTHRFDVVVRGGKPHEATPLSVKSAYRIETMAIEVSLWTRLFSTVDATKRAEQRIQIEGDAETAVQALNYPNNLLFTQDAEATGIVSGMLKGPEGESTPVWELVEENWETLILRSRITGVALVSKQQAVA